MEFDGGSRVLFVDEAGVKSCEGSEEKHSSHCEEYDSEEEERMYEESENGFEDINLKSDSEYEKNPFISSQ